MRSNEIDLESPNLHNSREKRNSPTKRSLNGNGERIPTAFSVARTSCVMGQSSNHSRVDPIRNGAITYDKSFVNVGKSLNLGTGEFTVPVSGLYFFSFTVGKYPRKRLSVSLIKNENEFQVRLFQIYITFSSFMQFFLAFLNYPIKNG